MAFATEKWAEDFATEKLESLDIQGILSPKIENQIRNAELRERIRIKLEGEEEYEMANKLAGCGLPYHLTCMACCEKSIVETHCKRRWCPACAGMIARKRLTRYAGAVSLMADPTSVTLTIRNSPDPESVRELRADWGRMRRRKIFADKVKGGIAAIEVTNQGNGWHPHLHAIIDCPWLSVATPRPRWSDTPEEKAEKCRHAQMELSHAWADACKQEASIVWIKRCKSDAALVYALKYCVAGSDLADSPDPIGPLISVMDRSRLISAFGSLYGRTAEMDGDEKPGCVCPHCNAEKSMMPPELVDLYFRTDPTKTRLTAHFGPDFHAMHPRPLPS